MENNSSNLRKTLHFLTPYRTQIGILVALTVLMAALATIPPLCTRALVDRVFTGGEVEIFVPLAIGQVFIWVIYLLIGLYQSTLCAWVGSRFSLDIRNTLYRHMLHLSLRFFGKHSAGKLVNRLMGDTGMLQQMLSAQTMTVVSDLIVSLCSIIATILISWRLFLVLMIFLVLFVVNYRVNIKKIIQSSRSLRGMEDRLSGGVQNRLAADLAVKSFGTESREHKEFSEHSALMVDYGKVQGVSNNGFWMTVGLIHQTGAAVLYFLGCAQVLAGDLSYGDVMAFNQYAVQLLWPAVRFSQLVNQLQQMAISAERIYEIFEEKPEIQDAPDAMRCPKLTGAVEFRDVRFHYVPGVEIIRGFSLNVKPGETIALIGPTGCGKSTILNLISRFYDVTGGELLLDGLDIRKLSLKRLRQQFGIVLQESHLFSTSIRENIRYAHPEVSEEQVIRAAKAAEIHDFIASLPKGYDTLVGDYGIELSLGQKQRINIARAICADPAIMIMDEATSSLDSDSEAAIQRAMERVLKGRTSFVVAHRL
ncbi:MAG: ABC transporter ATP-binding protein, partial [Victivallales bacterium]|nr:ABC transporter ATP-binding protein [Victivallales bacterium]